MAQTTTHHSNPRLRRDKGSLTERKAHWFLLAPTLAAMAVITAYPFVYGIISSLQDTSLANPNGRFVGLANYIDLASDPQTWHSIWLTLVFTFWSVTGSFVLGMLGALVLNRRFPGRGLIRSLFIIPWAIPAFVAALTWGWIFNDQFGILTALLRRAGMVDVPAWLGVDWAMTSLIIVMIWKSFPFQLVMILAGLQAIPNELYEAAAIDGAGTVRQFQTITMPLLQPIVLVSVFMAVINAFQHFPIPWILTSGGPASATNVISISSYNLAFSAGQVSRGAAVAGIMFIVTLVGAVFYIRFYIRQVGQI